MKAPLGLAWSVLVSIASTAFAQITVVDETIYKAPPGYAPQFGYQMSLGNANGDEHPDLYVCDDQVHLSGYVAVLAGPDFTSPTVMSIPGTAPYRALGVGWKVADLNLDGLDDVIAGAAASSVGGFEYVGRTFVSFAPTFQNTTELPLPLPPSTELFFGGFVEAGDYDRDGLPDVFVGTYGAEVQHVINAGRIDVYSGASGFSGPPIATLEPPNPVLGGLWGYGLAVADYDADGRSDLLTRDNWGFSWLKQFDLANTFSIQPPPIGFSLGARVRIDDMNADGVLDIVASELLTGGGQAVVFSGPTYLPRVFLQPTTNTTSAQAGLGLDVGDFNRDGHKDVAIGAPFDHAGGLNYSGRVTVFFGPDYLQKQEIRGEYKNSYFGMGVLLHDFDHDGFHELLVAAGVEWGGGSLHLVHHEPLALLTSNTVSLASGGTVKFALQRGALSGAAPYLLLMSASGSTPGFDVPYAGGAFHVPLNADAATSLAIQLANTPVFFDFQGTLDPQGNASPRLVVPPNSSSPALIGLNLTFAAVLAENGPAVDFATNAVTVVLGA